MDRRQWGVVMLVTVLLLALLVPVIGGRRMPGVAARVPIPGPPQVGDCLTTEVGSGRSALAYAQTTVFAPSLGPCGEHNYGEVVFLASDSSSFPASVVNRMSNPEPLACESSAAGYLGWPTDSPQPADPAPGSVDRMLGNWRPAATAAVALIGPDLAQYLVGQDWIACVVLPQVAPYAGSGRGGLAGGSADAFGVCVVDGGMPVQQAVPCSDAHRSEIFATIAAQDQTRAVDLESCFRLVQRLTDMADPTAGGALQIEVATDRSVVAMTHTVQAPAVAARAGRCVVTALGERRLGASLVGIGDRPLPWV
jgi:hypothetical protein